MTRTIKEVQERNLMRYDLIKKDRVIEGLKEDLAKARLRAEERYADGWLCAAKFVDDLGNGMDAADHNVQNTWDISEDLTYVYASLVKGHGLVNKIEASSGGDPLVSKLSRAAASAGYRTPAPAADSDYEDRSAHSFDFVRIEVEREDGFDFTTTDFGDQETEVPIEDQVNAAGNRIADGIENGDYTVQQGDDIALVMDFMNETLQKTKAKHEEREREFEDTVGELSIAQDKIYRIKLALED